MARKKLLAVNFGGIGDEILFLPTLESIRRHHPQAQITLLLEPRSASAAQITDLVDRVITFDIKKRPLEVADLLELTSLIRGGGYDIVVSSGSSFMVSVLLFLSGVPVRVGYGTSRLSRLLLTNPVALNRKQYAANMYHDLVRGLDISDTPDLPRATLNAESLQRIDALLPGGDFKRILIHPGTSRLALQKGIVKTWSIENWLQLIERLSQQPDVQVVLAGGPDDRETVREIVQRVRPGSSAAFISGTEWTRSLADLAALIYRCDLMVCVDSAPMHLAVALRKPIVALFGPTDESHLLPDHGLFHALRQPTIELPSLDSGVRLPPYIVFQSVLDQLAAASNQGSFQESPH